ncbi:hypothetical protein [Niallia sp. NCCP-28]|uniref:hypothetical protein n=1 Tax=Niallia sp. NCCP-28 TaxID=2934712 RepID=UPI00208B8BBC|nr:hypothetical protein [Niallia sp. NCCP-28]GKU80641.1 hypothetical protein NCCP28_00370 [Niallia sp. NCCP-28]
MKTYLVISQILYAVCLLPWLVVFGMSFMSFDQGISFANSAFVIGIGVYPLFVIICSIYAWIYRKRKKKLAIIVNFLPMLWIIGLGVPLFLLNI